MTTTVPSALVAQDGGIKLAHLHPEVSTAFQASPNVKLSGDDVQMVYSATGAYASGTTQTPISTSVPTNTQGDQYLSATITPTSAANQLVIDIILHVSTSNAGSHFTAALFQDAGANALACGISYAPAANCMLQVRLRHVMAAGTTSATTFKVRCGGNVAATVSFNGTAAGTLLGGTMLSSISITERKP
jgi:hypothetical protein